MTDTRLTFYGRRKGRPLLKTHRALFNQLMPKVGLKLTESMINPIHILQTPEVWLEIGFGGGEHLAYQAERNPSVGLVGAEAFINGISSLIRHIDEKKLLNIKIFEGDVRLLFPKIIPKSFSKIFILFPDPWPKKKHHRRRLINSESLEILHRLLTARGLLRIVSDEPSYIEWILKIFETSDLFSKPIGNEESWQAPPNDWIQTRYEKKARHEGRTPVYLDFVKI